MPNREAINKQKVYTKLKAADAWVEDKTLYWTGGPSARGTSQSSFAGIIPITPGGLNVAAGSIAQNEIDEAKLRMSYGLEEYLGLDGTGLDNGIPKGKWILVTKLDSESVERPRFIGQAWTVKREFMGGEMVNSATAMGYDMVLSMYNPYGGLMIDTNDTLYHFLTVQPIFNEGSKPNRSELKYESQGLGNGGETYVYDYADVRNWDNEFWLPHDVTTYIFNRLRFQGVYPFHNGITNLQEDFEGADPFVDSSKIRPYDSNTTNIWTILTQMVETNGRFTTTILYEGTGTSSYAKVGVIENG